MLSNGKTAMDLRSSFGLSGVVSRIKNKTPAKTKAPTPAISPIFIPDDFLALFASSDSGVGATPIWVKIE